LNEAILVVGNANPARFFHPWVSGFWHLSTPGTHETLDLSAAFDLIITQCPCRVSQGTVLGPLLFAAYISLISTVALQFSVGHHQYADDTQMCVALSPFDINTTFKTVSQLYTYGSVRMVLS